MLMKLLLLYVCQEQVEKKSFDFIQPKAALFHFCALNRCTIFSTASCQFNNISFGDVHLIEIFYLTVFTVTFVCHVQFFFQALPLLSVFFIFKQHMQLFLMGYSQEDFPSPIFLEHLYKQLQGFQT